ncbi:hypothetical protein SKAU_G00242170 [Synaphobranchus kaupii]|uniref:Uncharacterized protein n=1 Tax=Synaphobranchus kaupii TaxID=118154 RepID=A0A9Q1F7Q6_SYNKA|nr:hypothetical protein SKAU_G00242170 [Synaphobranchus kaupii]
MIDRSRTVSDWNGRCRPRVMNSPLSASSWSLARLTQAVKAGRGPRSGAEGTAVEEGRTRFGAQRRGGRAVGQAGKFRGMTSAPLL